MSGWAPEGYTQAEIDRADRAIWVRRFVRDQRSLGVSRKDISRLLGVSIMRVWFIEREIARGWPV
jgi:hypothetical protein